MIYRFMKQHHAEFEVQVMCQAFGVSRSGYYAWQKRGERTQREQNDAQLTQQMQTIFEASHQTYGSPRISAELKAQGIRCSRDRVGRLMRQVHLSAVLPRRRMHTTHASGQSHSPCNRLQRDFTAQAPNQKWLVDITAVSTD